MTTTEPTTPIDSKANPKVPFLRYSVLRDEISLLDLNFYLTFPMQIYKTVPEVGNPPVIYEDDWFQKEDATTYMTESEINNVHAEGIKFFQAISEKRAKWHRLVQDGKPLRPTCHRVTQGFLEMVSICSYQYGVNPWIDAICIGFLWSIILGMISVVIWFVLLVIFFPVGFIYDVISGRRSAQAAWFHCKVNQEGYSECGSINSENKLVVDLETYGKTLVEKFGANNVSIDLFKDIQNKQVLHHNTDNDYYVTHKFARYSMVVSWIGPLAPVAVVAASDTTGTLGADSKV